MTAAVRESARSVEFRRVTGALELALDEAWRSTPHTPAKVTATLAVALAPPGSGGDVAEVVRNLPVGERQLLARELATHLGRNRVWLTTDCSSCGHAFDFEVDQASLPVKEASVAADDVVVDTSLGRVAARLPVGADQEAVAAIADDDDALLALLDRCTSFEDGGTTVSDLTEDDIEAIDRALENAACEVGILASAECPDCGTSHTVTINPYLSLGGSDPELWSDIHTIARVYHWDESAILDLPRDRRLRYLTMIESDQGPRG